MAKKVVSVAQFVASALGASGRTNADVAQDVFGDATRANLVSMIKMGRAKLPVDKVPAFAKATMQDPVYLLQLVLREYSPSLFSILEPYLANALTEGEAEVISLMRKEGDDLPIRFTDSQLVTIQGFAREAAGVAKKAMSSGLKAAQASQRGGNEPNYAPLTSHKAMLKAKLA